MKKSLLADLSYIRTYHTYYVGNNHFFEIFWSALNVAVRKTAVALGR